MKMYEIIYPKRDYIFEACITVDGRYYLIHDEVFDMQEQRTLGNVWSSIDVFKNIFQNIRLKDNEYKEIRENIISLPILEGKENLYGLRDILLEAGFLDNTWVGRQFKSAGQGIADFTKTSWEGVKKFGIAISEGEWGEIISLLAKGVRYVLRKLKDALYSAIGITIDAILVATGIGKGVQWIPWALITALDVYQITTNDWPAEEQNDPMWMKFLTLGFDVLGLVSTGAIAKGAKMSFAPLKALKTPEQAAKFFAKNPKLKGVVQSIINGSSKVPKMMSNAQKFLSSKFPAGAKFLSGILGKISSIMSKLVESLKSLIGTKGLAATKAGTTTGGMIYGIEKGAEKVFSKPSRVVPTGMSDLELQNIKAIESVFAGV